MRGFTLIELMATTLVAALLTAIALPGYRGVVMRSQRSDARIALLRIQAQQERHYLQQHRYGADLVSSPAVGGLGVGARSELGHYTLSVTLTHDGQGYRASATPAPGHAQQADVQCPGLWIDQSGLQQPEGCWR